MKSEHLFGVRPAQASRLLAGGLLAACLLGATGFAQAQVRDVKARGYTPGELALLPDWCIDSQDGPYGAPDYGGMNKSPRAPHWMSLMGTDFWHMHHYCRALRDMRRANTPGITKRDRDFVLARAISDFEYTVINCRPTMPLMPEVLLKMGETYLMQGELAQAQATLARARELKPDYWPAYQRWAEVLIGLKQWDIARGLVNEGLKHSPEQPALMAQLKSIDAAAGAKPRARTSAAAPAASNPR